VAVAPGPSASGATGARAVAGDKRFERSILRNGERASKQFADMLENMNGFADNIKDATKEFKKDELEFSAVMSPFRK
jgi:hypothetical protein